MARDTQNQGQSRSLVPLANSYGYRYTQAPGQQGSQWFGPLKPMAPIAPPEVKGRILDYPSGYNLNVRPRSYESITFEQLRSFADSYDLLRILIETRKDQMSRLAWNVVPRDKKLRGRGATIPGNVETRINAIKEFFLRPDKENFWGDWLRMLLEDLFVIDAPSVYRRRTFGGDLYALQPLDGATIKRVIDDFGNTPLAPEPAYQQVLKGYPAADYSTEELLYRPRNRRTHKIYGYSPVEQIVMTINIGMRRQVWQLQSFTEGNIPEALIGTPTTWTPDQIRQFQDWWDSMLEGNSGQKRSAKFVPGEIAKGYVATKPSELFGEAEDWLIRVMCFAFSISPQPFIKMMNRATAETAQETAVSEGLAPIQGWVKGMMDTILIDDFASADLEFIFENEDELDPDIKSKIVDREQAAGRLTYNEARREQGLDAFVHPDADRPMFKSTTGWSPIFLTPEEQKAKDDAAKALAAGPADDSEGDTPPGGEDTTESEVVEKHDRPFSVLGKAAGGKGSGSKTEHEPAGSPKGGQFKSKHGWDGTSGEAGVYHAGLKAKAEAGDSIAASHLKAREESHNLALERSRDYEGRDLTKAEQGALNTYTSNAYKKINDGLRNDALPESRKKMVEHLDGAIASERTRHEVTLYRGIKGSKHDDWKPGTEISDKAFQSTSYKKGEALNFGLQSKASGVKPTLLEITAPKGTNALNVHPGRYPSASYSHEVVLGRGTKYTVTGTRTEKHEGRDVTVVQVKIKGPDGD